MNSSMSEMLDVGLEEVVSLEESTSFPIILSEDNDVEQEALDIEPYGLDNNSKHSNFINICQA